MNLYKPQKKIIVASSFEGVLNNGARECAFVSLNAYRKMQMAGQIKSIVSRTEFSDKLLSPEEFNKKTKDDIVVKTFLALRPKVAVAEDYYSVLQAIDVNYGMAMLLVANPQNVDLIKFFIAKFDFLKGFEKATDERKIFNSEFYAERKRVQGESYEAWLSLQEPFPGTIDQLRQLLKLRDFENNEVASGFELYYVTAKDEASTYQLCTAYTKFGHLLASEVGDGNTARRPVSIVGSLADIGNFEWGTFFQGLTTCIIRREHIIGNETVKSKDKLLQMQMVAANENVPPEQVWGLNDRFDWEEVKKLREEGFVNQFITTGGYAFSWDYADAARNGVIVVDRMNLALALSNIAMAKKF